MILPTPEMSEITPEERERLKREIEADIKKGIEQTADLFTPKGWNYGPGRDPTKDILPDDFFPPGD